MRAHLTSRALPNRALYDTWLNGKIAACLNAEEQAIATIDRIEARRLQGTRIERAEWEDGKVYISESQCFNDVPESVWTRTIGGYQIAKKLLIDRTRQILSFEEALQYLRILRELGKEAKQLPPQT